MVAVPQGAPGPTGPTGQAFVGGQGFVTDAGAAASFVFASLQGTISAWNAGTTAVTQFTAPDHAIYTGLDGRRRPALRGRCRERQDRRVQQHLRPDIGVGCVQGSGGAGGIRPVQHPEHQRQTVRHYFVRGQPGGYVAVFDENGNLLQHISDPHLNSPWGVAIAPAGFGQFANALLVGNFGDGTINAFDAMTGAFLGTVRMRSGIPWSTRACGRSGSAHRAGP